MGISRGGHCFNGRVLFFDHDIRRCVEILISEQFRRYNEKMQNIQQLEYAEALAVSQLKLRRQNTVRENLKTCVSHRVTASGPYSRKVALRKVWEIASVN